MSKFSGKCDLYDHIAGMGGWYDQHGNKVKFGQKNVSCYYSDELQDFEAFKKATNGKLHRHYKVVVTQFNQEFVKQHCKEFDFIKHSEERPNKVSKTGFKTFTYYTYIYFGKEYSLKELNKHGVYIDVEILFDTLLDIIPYYPYIVTACYQADGTQYVVISNESFVESSFKDHLQYGWIDSIDYRQILQEHYLEVCKNYFLNDLAARTKQISLIGYKPLHNGYYELLLPTPADYMHKVKFVWNTGKAKAHWCGPILKDVNTVLISEQDIDHFLADDIKNNTVNLEYVEKVIDKELHLC